MNGENGVWPKKKALKQKSWKRKFIPPFYSLLEVSGGRKDTSI